LSIEKISGNEQTLSHFGLFVCLVTQADRLQTIKTEHFRVYTFSQAFCPVLVCSKLHNIFFKLFFYKRRA